MPGSANNGTVRILTQGSACSRDIYQGYASGLYRQAFLTLGDTALAWVLSLTSSPRARAGPGAAVQAKISPLITKTSGVSPRAIAAVTPSA